MPRGSRGLQRLERAATLQPLGSVDVVPQNGGRLIQVSFRRTSNICSSIHNWRENISRPTNDKWFNYGGDKLWLLPEGNDDEQHWVGNSDILDDGPFTFRKLSEGKQCEIELTGPADPQTGIQFSRTIRLDSDSPRIRFHASMKNVSGPHRELVDAVGLAVQHL